MTNTEKPKNWKEPVMKKVFHPDGAVSIFLLAERWDNMYGYMRKTESWAIVRRRGQPLRPITKQHVAPIVMIVGPQDLARDCPHCGVAPGEHCIAVNIAVIHTERRTRQPLPKPEAKPLNIPLPKKRVEQPGPKEEKVIKEEPEEKTEPQNEVPVRDTEPVPSELVEDSSGESETDESILQKWERLAREADEREDS